jgi:iron complex outermembrane recepter protein
VTHSTSKLTALSQISFWAILPALAVISPELAHADATAPASTPGEGATASEIVVSGKGAPPSPKDPAIVTSIGGDTVGTLGLQTVADLTGIAPGIFQPHTAITPSHTTIFIRGIGEITQQGRPSVPVYIDGVYIPRTAGANQDLLDVESIDVARGPQGFAWGHSAEGGTVSIRTLTPDNDLRGQVEAGYGSYNEWKLGGVISGPLVRDQVYASLAVEHHARDGITHDVTTGQDVNALDSTSLRAKLRFTPNSRLDITNIFDATIDNGDAKVFGNLALSNNPNIAFSPIDPVNRYREFSYTLLAKYDLTDALRWENTAGYRHYTYWTNYDNTGDLYGRGIGLLGYHENFYTAETRLVGSFKAVDFSAGVHFAREEFQRSGANNGTTTYTVNPNLSVFTPIWSVANQRYNNVAAFAQASLRFADAWKLTLGGRLNYEDQSQQMADYSLGPTAGYSVTGWQLDQQILYAASAYRHSTPPPGATLAWSVNESHPFTRFTPKAALEYAFAPDSRVYASFSQGTHEGGFDNGGLSPLAAGRNQDSIAFAPERVTTYETGLHTGFGGRLATLDTAVFYNRFDDIQLTTLDPVTNISHRYNAGTGRSWGAEGDLHINPVKDFTLGLTASFLSAKLINFAGNATSVSYASGLTLHSTPFVGARLPYSPQFQGQANAQYSHAVSGVGRFAIGGNVAYQTSSFTDALSNGVNEIPAQTLANAFVSYTDPSERVVLRVDVRNLTNKQYAQYKTYIQNSGTLIAYTASYNDPRTVFASLGYKF